MEPERHIVEVDDSDFIRGGEASCGVPDDFQCPPLSTPPSSDPDSVGFDAPLESDEPRLDFEAAAALARNEEEMEIVKGAKEYACCDEVVVFQVENVVSLFLAPPSFQPVGLTNGPARMRIVLLTEAPIKRRSAPSLPELLKPAPPPRKVYSEPKLDERGMYVLQIGENKETLRFPLCKQTPFLRMRPGEYLFDFFFSNEIYKILFPSNIPPAFCSAFEAQLDKICNQPLRFKEVISDLPNNSSSMVAFQSQEIVSAETVQPVSLPVDRVSTIESRAEDLSNAVIRAGKALSEIIEKRGEKIKANSEPAKKPAEVSPVVEKTINMVSSISPYIATGSKMVISAIACMAANVVGRIDTSSGENDSEIKKIAVASLKGGVKIVQSLETAGEEVFHSTRASVSGVVTHKYGEKAGDLTVKTFNIGRDMAETVGSVRSAVVKTAAETVVQVVKKEEKRKKSKRVQVVNALEDEYGKETIEIVEVFEEGETIEVTEVQEPLIQELDDDAEMQVGEINTSER